MSLCSCGGFKFFSSDLFPAILFLMVYSRRHFELRGGGGGGGGGGRELQLAICSLEKKLGRQLGKWGKRKKILFIKKDTNNKRHATFETKIKVEGLKTEIPEIRISPLLILVAGSIKKKSPPPPFLQCPPPRGPKLNFEPSLFTYSSFPFFAHKYYGGRRKYRGRYKAMLTSLLKTWGRKWRDGGGGREMFSLEMDLI